MQSGEQKSGFLLIIDDISLFLELFRWYKSVLKKGVVVQKCAGVDELQVQNGQKMFKLRRFWGIFLALILHNTGGERNMTTFSDLVVIYFFRGYPEKAIA